MSSVSPLETRILEPFTQFGTYLTLFYRGRKGDTGDTGGQTHPLGCLFPCSVHCGRPVLLVSGFLVILQNPHKQITKLNRHVSVMCYYIFIETNNAGDREMNKEAAKKAMGVIRTAVSAEWFLKNDPAEKFEGDVLLAAVAFKKHLEREVEEYQGIVCCRTLQNARSGAFLELTKPARKEVKNPCPRCDGTGQMPFRHVKGGVCFKCEGTGRSK